jgi:L-ascorbate metabolism protein UlaG (beta-lactamase superfamily)
MKISKYIHSCLLFEQDGYQLLVDPGKFSFAEGLVTPEDFAKVNTVVITHIHPDHFDPDNLEKIIELSKATVYTTDEVAKELNKKGIPSILLAEKEYQIGPFHLAVIAVKHQPLLDSLIPKMFGFILNGKILHPVDSFADGLLKYQGMELLILPVTAPFTKELEIAAFADQLKPKHILPVHDGYVKEFFIKQRYKVFEEHFKQSGIKFHMVNQPGESILI